MSGHGTEWLNEHIVVLSREEPEIIKDWKRVVVEMMAYGMENVAVGRIHTAFILAEHSRPKMTQEQREEQQRFLDEAAGM